MTRAYDPVVALRRWRGRPGSVLERGAVARQREAVVAPGETHGAQARQRLFVEQELRLAAGRR